MRLFGIAEVEAIGGANRVCARGRYLARGLSHGMHRTETRIEITPARVAVQRHRQAELRTFNANDTSIARAGRLDSIGLHHVIVLLPNPALTANVRAGQQLLQMLSEFGRGTWLDMLRHLARHGRFPAL